MLSLWIKEKVIVMFLLVFVVVNMFGLSFTMDHQMSGGHMAACPFMGETASVCQMTLSDHVTKWKEMFIALLPTMTLLTLLILGITMMVLIFTLAPPWLNRVSLLLRNYKKLHPDIKFFNPLILAFAQGILHPRIYA